MPSTPFNGWSSTFGFGFNPNGTTSTNGADYIAFADPGDGSLLRVAILPEPGTIALLGLGLTGLLARRRREC